MKQIILTVLALGVVSCSNEPVEQSGDGDLEAKGEILGGTIRDDMLPLESVSSQSPPLAGEAERLERLTQEREEQARETDLATEPATEPADGPVLETGTAETPPAATFPEEG